MRNTFSSFLLKESLLKRIKELGFDEPTPIQNKVIPHMLSSKQDLVASAQTGTGKTAAFGLPLIQLNKPDNNQIQTLILCPTRELCLQIGKDLLSYSKYIKSMNIVTVYGGEKIERQIKLLKKDPKVIVGTPGRTKDLIKRKKLFIGKIERLILDESDEMLSMGFKEDLEYIIKSGSKDKQILLFSATMSSKVVEVRKKYMKNPLEIKVAGLNRAADNVDHIFYTVQAKDRYEVIKRIADMSPNIYGIVFCRTKRETKEVTSKLMSDNYNADTIHGDLSQSERNDVMARFRKRNVNILVATDVAARGLDIKELSHVINYNLPDEDETYIHRSGRTGRAGRNGISVAIVHQREHRRIKNIERKAGILFEKKRIPDGFEICKKRLYALIDKVEKVKVNEDQIEQFLPYIYDKLNWLDREELIKHFVSIEFNRYLSYYRNARDINIDMDSKDKRQTKKYKRKRRKFNHLKRNRKRKFR